MFTDSLILNIMLLFLEMNTSAMKIVKVRGIKFQMDTSGKTLKRMDSSPVKSGIINDTIVSEYFNQKTAPSIKTKIVRDILTNNEKYI